MIFDDPTAEWKEGRKSSGFAEGLGFSSRLLFIFADSGLGLIFTNRSGGTSGMEFKYTFLSSFSCEVYKHEILLKAIVQRIILGGEPPAYSLVQQILKFSSPCSAG